MLQLSTHNLSEQLPRPATHSLGHHPDHLQHVDLVSSSSSWLLASKETIGSSFYPYTSLDHDHGVWVEERWRHQQSLDGFVEDSVEKEMNNSYLVEFCKSFCFIVLLTSFVMVIVIVSVYLSKGAKQW